MCIPTLLGILISLSVTPEPAPTPGVQLSLASQEAPFQEADADLPDRRRILHLDGGDVVRGRTRRVAGAWERREDRTWVPVLAEVERHVLERELLAQARARRASTPKEPSDERVQLAAWMGAEGLEREALHELDVILSDHPDHPAALALLASEVLTGTLATKARVGSVPWVQAVMQEGAGGSPARREQCVRMLAPLVGLDGFSELLVTGMTQANDQHREFALLAARRLVPGQLCQELSRRAILDTMPGVRLEAARGLRDARDASWIGPAVRALDSQHDKVRANAAEALGHMGYKAAVEPLALRLKSIAAAQSGGGHVGGTRSNLTVTLETAYVQDFDVEIAPGASIADPQIQTVTSGVIFDVRAQAQRTVVVEWRAVTGSLKQLTGADPGRKPDRWLDWWDANQARWRAKDHLPRRPVTGDGDKASGD